DVAVIDRGHADALSQKWGDIQLSEVRSFWSRDFLLLPVPNLARLDSGIIDYSRIRRKTQIEQQRNRLAGAGGPINQQIHLRPRFVSREIDGHLPAKSFPVQRGRSLIENIEAHSGRTTRTAAELVLLEQADDFGPPFLYPGFGVADLGA